MLYFEYGKCTVVCFFLILKVIDTCKLLYRGRSLMFILKSDANYSWKNLINAHSIGMNHWGKMDHYFSFSVTQNTMSCRHFISSVACCKGTYKSISNVEFTLVTRQSNLLMFYWHSSASPSTVFIEFRRDTQPTRLVWNLKGLHQN